MAVDAPVPENIDAFFETPTPEAWLDAASDRIPELLLDHANCELKAASTALGFLYRYPERTALAQRMSRLAREELRHFEQVVAILKDRNITYAQISSSRYAGELRSDVRSHDPARLIDILIVSAIVEARSCERFSCLIDLLDSELAEFYASLLKSEARHFKVYLDFAHEAANGADISDRIQHFLAKEQVLIESPDELFRFHSGRPV